MSDNTTVVLERWTEDPEFRTWLRADTPAAVASLGITLGDEEKEKLAAIDWSLEDEELERQFVKLRTWGC